MNRRPALASGLASAVLALGLGLAPAAQAAPSGPSAPGGHSVCFGEGPTLALTGNRVVAGGGTWCNGAISVVTVTLDEYLAGAYRKEASHTNVVLGFENWVTVRSIPCLDHLPHSWKVILTWSGAGSGATKTLTKTLNCF